MLWSLDTCKAPNIENIQAYICMSNLSLIHIYCKYGMGHCVHLKLKNVFNLKNSRMFHPYQTGTTVTCTCQGRYCMSEDMGVLYPWFCRRKCFVGERLLRNQMIWVIHVCDVYSHTNKQAKAKHMRGSAAIHMKITDMSWVPVIEFYMRNLANTVVSHR